MIHKTTRFAVFGHSDAQFVSADNSSVPTIRQCGQFVSADNSSVPTIRQCRQFVSADNSSVRPILSADNSSVPTIRQCGQFSVRTIRQCRQLVNADALEQLELGNFGMLAKRHIQIQNFPKFRHILI
ncbi:MAG: hypothetical protein SGJ27_13350 [Candidatus Melainabacteria bacterium]|nr:hypothetical protein [Candidatus Melainabacteria bacterium]